MKRMARSGAFAAVCLFAVATTAEAVLVYDGTAANLSAPSDDPGWDAVGTISGPGPATAVFLGNNGGFAWFLTANHVNLSSATLTIGGVGYSVFAGINQIGTADLKVFRIDSTIAGINPVSLASSNPSINASVTMIGNGATGTFVTWDTSATPTWTSPGTGAEGYTWSGPNVKQWGTNTVLARNLALGSSTAMATDFDNVAGEAQGSLGDSGGAVFHKTGTNWELAALIVAVGRVEGNTLYDTDFAGQPGSTSVAAITGQPNNKSVTYSVQIADYRSSILAAIPEPSTIAVTAMAAVFFAGLSGYKRKFRG